MRIVPAVGAAGADDERAPAADGRAEIGAAGEDFDGVAAADGETAEGTPGEPKDGARRELDAGRQRDTADESTVPPFEMIAPLTMAPNSMISVPPALTKLLLAVPPIRSLTPPLLTVVLVSSPPLAISSEPLLMVQWAVLALVTVQVPPTTLKVVKPRY